MEITNGTVTSNNVNKEKSEKELYEKLHQKYGGLKDTSYSDRFIIQKNSFQYSLKQGKLIKKLNSGEYNYYRTEQGPMVDKTNLPDLKFIKDIKDGIIDKLLDEIDNFWEKEQIYKEYGETHKRGYLLWGPPGCGKTFLMRRIIKQFIKKENGVVFKINSNLIRDYQLLQSYFDKGQKFLLYFENLDEIYNKENHDSSKSTIETFIDNSNPDLSNTIMLFTTNFPEKIPQKILDRPNRIDRIIDIMFPTRNERRKFLNKKSKKLTEKQINKIVSLTDNFSFAHLNEIIMAVELYENKIEDTIKRINSMSDISSEQYEKLLKKRGSKNKGLGFSG